MWSVARRPRWIGMLFLVLALAAAFVALSQWQLSRSVQNGTPIVRHTETVDRLSAVTKPQSPVTDKLDGQLIETTGRWVPDEYTLISDRLNNGTQGWWVVGHFSAETRTGSPAGLAVALGWASTEQRAKAAMNNLAEPSGMVRISGRYNVSDDPSSTDFTHDKLSTVSSAALLNTWKKTDAGGIYSGYVTLSSAVPGLDVIYSPPPVTSVQVDLLNIFYAIEWIVFAGFALFLWYRLVKDAWEREQEELAEQAEQEEHELSEVN
jgi:surfeit locus 1 family protein